MFIKKKLWKKKRKIVLFLDIHRTFIFLLCNTLSEKNHLVSQASNIDFIYNNCDDIIHVLFVLHIQGEML